MVSYTLDGNIARSALPMRTTRYKSTTAGVNLEMSGPFDIANKGGNDGIGPWGLSFGQTSGSAAVAPSTLYVRSDKQLVRPIPQICERRNGVEFTSAIAGHRRISDGAHEGAGGRERPATQGVHRGEA